jgi:hypothetical protein
MKTQDDLPARAIDRLKNFDRKIDRADLVIRAMPWTYLWICTCAQVYEVSVNDLGEVTTCGECGRKVVPF